MTLITEANRKWWVLFGTSAALFQLMLDSTAVTLALPSIQGDLDASNDQLQWLLNAYLLVMAMLVVTAGRFGDIFGRRRIFSIGFAIFGLGSVLAAAAWSPDVLIGSRVVMAAGAAAMLPLSLALVTHVFPPAEQARAIGIWAAISALALGFGPLIGGALADIEWRLIFAINIPIVIAGVGIIRASAPEMKDETSGHRIDWVGLALLTIGLTATVFALMNADHWGWSSTSTLILLLGGIAALAAFWFIEHRVRSPIVDFSLFRNRPYLGATAAAFGIVAVFWTLLFYEPQYLQNILDYSTIEAGLLMLPLTIPMIVLSPFSASIMGAVGARAMMTTGMVLGVIGTMILTQISESSGYGLLFSGFLPLGLAFALVYAPMSTAAMAAMPKAKAGIASGALAMNRILAGALGLAIIGAMFQSLLSDRLNSRLGDDLDKDEISQLDGLLAGSEKAREAIQNDPPETAAAIEQTAREVFSFGLGNALWVLVGVIAVCAVLTWWLVEPKEPSTKTPEAASTNAHKHHMYGRFHL